MRFFFIIDTRADGSDGMGRSFKGGKPFDDTEISSGCLESGLRLGTIKAIEEPASINDDTVANQGTGEQQTDAELPVPLSVPKPRGRGRGART